MAVDLVDKDVEDLEHRRVADAEGHPGSDYGQQSVTVSPDEYRSDGMDDCQVAIDRHENEGVDARVCRDVYEVLVHLAPRRPEGPGRRDVAGGRERDAEHDEDEIGESEVQHEDVRHVTSLPVEEDRRYDDEVA